MPLPKNWNGAFWGHEELDDCLFDLEPRKFVQFIFSSQGDYLFTYLMAGAYFDLKRNGYSERAESVKSEVEETVPNYHWETIWEFVDGDLKKLVDEGAPPEMYCTALAFLTDE